MQRRPQYRFRLVDSKGTTFALAESRDAIENAKRLEMQRRADLLAYAPLFWTPKLFPLNVVSI